MTKFETRNALFGYIWDRILKTIVALEISTLKFVKWQNFAKKQNFLNWGPKMLYLGIFGVEF